MKNLSNQQTVIIMGFLACVTVLALTGRETGALVAVGVAILAGLGLSLGQQQSIKENTNGTVSRIVEINERAAAQQAATSARALELLEGQQRALVALAHRMGTMTAPEQLELMRSDQDKHAA